MDRLEFHLLTIGRFTRNRFWGELETQAYRDVLCTSTLITGREHIVVDPSLPPEQMAKVLFDRSGLRPEAIGAVFVTHSHGDHLVGLKLFEKARWYMGALELENMKKSGKPETVELAEKFLPLEPGSLEGVEGLPLPGHTAGLTGLAFTGVFGRVVIAGDAVMNRDFFIHQVGYYNALDQKRSTESIRKIAAMADYVVPGHDNYFPVMR
jgi:glyoxylase-like metal-dependent hydrolase (beta-lactamase superfamily II)